MGVHVWVPDGDAREPGFAVQSSNHGLSVSAGALADSPAMFGVMNDEGGLSVSAWPLLQRRPVSLGPWTVYTFLASGQFRLKAGALIPADVLMVGGGGAGGGGDQAGGGGAGEVADIHGDIITADETDGDVILGEGGSQSSFGSPGGQGEDSSFGGRTALGGGYGGSAYAPAEGYSEAGCWLPSSGGSGGGGRAYNAGSADYQYMASEGAYTRSFYDHVPGDGCLWDLTDAKVAPAGAATSGAGVDICKSRIPYGNGTEASYWTWVRTNGHAGAFPIEPWEDGANVYWVVAYPRGHTGYAGSGRGDRLVGGGGGGAHINPAYFTYDQFGEMQSDNPWHGGHGRPCDIRGWHGYAETDGVLSVADWYGGGGAAGSRDGGGWTWTPVVSKPGYGGGGERGSVGVHHTGGGGGGGYESEVGMEDGGEGGRGIVVVRISTADEHLVSYPLITGTDPDTDHNEFGLPVCLCDDPAVEIRRLPAYMTRKDESGDEQCPRTYEEVTHE